MKHFEDFFNEAKQYSEILKQYKENGKVFEDSNFHPIKEITESKFSFDKQEYTWRRIDDFYPVPIFKKESISDTYIQQGELKDSYFIAALIRIAKQPKLIEKLFDIRTKQNRNDSIDLKCGAVIVYFHIFGRKTPVLIDTLIPFQRGSRTPIFSHPTDNKYSAWFCLVEKAYAKLQGSYSSITTGTFSQAIYYLFGYYPCQYTISNLLEKRDKKQNTNSTNDENEYLFSNLMKWQYENSVIGTNISRNQSENDDEIKDNGLITSQTYLVKKVRREEGKNFICLRNPKNDHEWLGKWSNTSNLWTCEIKRKLGFERKNDGTFWMTDKDFFGYFTNFDVCKPFNPEYHIKSIKTKEGSSQTIVFKINEINTQTVDGEKIRLIVEKQSSEATKILIVYSNGRKIESTEIDQYRHQQFTTSGPVSCFTFSPLENDTFTIIFEGENSEEIFASFSFKYDFDLFDMEAPNELAMEDERVGILFNNESKRYRNVARKIVTKKIDNKVLNSYNDDSNFLTDPSLNKGSETNFDFYEYDISDNEEKTPSKYSEIIEKYFGPSSEKKSPSEMLECSLKKLQEFDNFTSALCRTLDINQKDNNLDSILNTLQQRLDSISHIQKENETLKNLCDDIASSIHKQSQNLTQSGESSTENKSQNDRKFASSASQSAKLDESENENSDIVKTTEQVSDFSESILSRNGDLQPSQFFSEEEAKASNKDRDAFDFTCDDEAVQEGSNEGDKIDPVKENEVVDKYLKLISNEESQEPAADSDRSSSVHILDSSENKEISNGTTEEESTSVEIDSIEIIIKNQTINRQQSNEVSSEAQSEQQSNMSSNEINSETQSEQLNILSSNEINGENLSEKQNIEFNGENLSERQNIEFNSENLSERQNIEFNSENLSEKQNIEFNGENLSEKQNIEFNSENLSERGNLIGTESANNSEYKTNSEEIIFEKRFDMDSSNQIKIEIEEEEEEGNLLDASNDGSQNNLESLSESNSESKDSQNQPERSNENLIEISIEGSKTGTDNEKSSQIEQTSENSIEIQPKDDQNSIEQSNEILISSNSPKEEESEKSTTTPTVNNRLNQTKQTRRKPLKPAAEKQGENTSQNKNQEKKENSNRPKQNIRNQRKEKVTNDSDKNQQKTDEKSDSEKPRRQIKRRQVSQTKKVEDPTENSSQKLDSELNLNSSQKSASDTNSNSSQRRKRSLQRKKTNNSMIVKVNPNKNNSELGACSDTISKAVPKRRSASACQKSPIYTNIVDDKAASQKREHKHLSDFEFEDEKVWKVEPSNNPSKPFVLSKEDAAKKHEQKGSTQQARPTQQQRKRVQKKEDSNQEKEKQEQKEVSEKEATKNKLSFSPVLVKEYDSSKRRSSQSSSKSGLKITISHSPEDPEVSITSDSIKIDDKKHHKIKSRDIQYSKHNHNKKDEKQSEKEKEKEEEEAKKKKPEKEKQEKDKEEEIKEKRKSCKKENDKRRCYSVKAHDSRQRTTTKAAPNSSSLQEKEPVKTSTEQSHLSESIPITIENVCNYQYQERIIQRRKRKLRQQEEDEFMFTEADLDRNNKYWDKKLSCERTYFNMKIGAEDPFFANINTSRFTRANSVSNHGRYYSSKPQTFMEKNNLNDVPLNCSYLPRPKQYF